VRDMFLPGLVVLVWVASWWRSRRFRLWFALRRNPPEPEPVSTWDSPETGSPETEDPSWRDLTRAPRRD
jgi:hypothetical protein